MTKKFLWMGLLTLGFSSAYGFSLLGPIANGPDAWQVDTIGYAVQGDLGAPKNLGEEYRRNTPVMYYAYDANFLDYFGSNGPVAIDQAFAIMNALTNVDSYNYTDQSGTNLFPFTTTMSNPTAGGLYLRDLKSEMLFALTEQMGLADSVRWTWALHDRYTVPGDTNACPADLEYLVIQRNFDPITWRPTDYVNNTLLQYVIEDNCGQGPEPESDAVELSADPIVSLPVTAGFGEGEFYTGLTWDDVGGLRYLYTSNNVNTESLPPGTLAYTTNFAADFALTTSNLFAFAQTTTATTNNPATIQALYPDLEISSVSNYFALAVTTNVVIYLTNYPGSPYGTFSTVVANNYTTNVQQFFLYTFGNVVTNKASIKTPATLQTITVAPKNGSPYGSPNVTNVTSKNLTLTVPSGDFYIFPSNSCGYDFLQTLQTNIVVVTNNLYTVTNGTLSYSQNLITHFTNHVFVVAPCALTNSGPALYQGVEKIKFVRADFDSLLGQFFAPITNNYSMTMVTNSQTVHQSLQRIVTAPDFVISAADLATGPADIPTDFVFSRNINFDTDNVYPGLAGPGTINPATTITFEKVGNIFLAGPTEDTNAFLGNTNFGVGGIYVTNLISQDFVWGSFGLSTNLSDIVVYPNGTDIQNLENQALIQISPSASTPLPNGTHGAPYPATTFTTTGGAFSPPFSWSAPGGLPPGMTLSSGGILAGTPTQAGTYSFVIQMTDSLARSVQWIYSVTIN